MDYLSTKQVSEKWSVSVRRILKLCEDGRIKGANKNCRSMVTAGGSRETYRCKNKKWKIYKRKVTTDLNKFNNCDEKKEDDLMAKVENKPKMVSLFSGCGGLDLGFETAGFNIIWANDFDSDAQAVYKLNFGKIDGRDILDVSEDEIPDCDILTAGFPCQPFSSAGK